MIARTEYGVHTPYGVLCIGMFHTYIPKDSHFLLIANWKIQFREPISSTLKKKKRSLSPASNWTNVDPIIGL